ncbi:sigma-70 family RNA polymerase sigma factor [Phytohabitans sp. ZYX-F-186]|uniref:Sigma-70 family RNA polymerase sigma factor n=1 Tax=Phytohabitans maris TaxID=3071409 RepID=A0ABU0ZJZ1_9ACTN|nr:sigma-70 family RNA polymerase sigma factor [Phytohabitans sp. ZYX-F-186]MDQ7907377.1 sigma-70 family RNA polymerase sigma factor [Phytohabitans sp. ZYX-F-186]
MTDEYTPPPAEPSAGSAAPADRSAEPSDAELIAAVRGGDPEPFALLYRRHVESARRMTRTLARDPADVEDLVAEAFAKLLATLESGGGPDSAFRPYLLTTIRRLFYDRIRKARREAVTDDPEAHDPGVPFVDTAVQGMEYAFVARAFARLPEHWQAVLWHTVVEGENPADVAPRMGLTPNGVAAMAYRARERLRQHYLQEHIAADPGEECRWAIERLGAHVRKGLSRRDGRRVEDHLDECRRCHLLFVELAEDSARMRGVLAVALLGGSAAAYVAGSGASAGSSLISRLARRRSVQAAAAGVVVVALGLAAFAMVRTGESTTVAEPPPAGPGAPPPPVPSTAVPPSAPPSTVVPPPGSTPSPAVPPGGPSPLSAPPSSPAPAVVPMEARLEPVGTLVRGRPGVLALTVVHPGQPGGSGGGGPVPASAPSTVDTGPLAAQVTLPRGVTLRAGPAGDGWTCTAARCTRRGLGVGGTTRAYLPVTVSDSAGTEVPRVRLTAPRARTLAVAAPVGVRPSGLPAVFAGTAPATLAVGGNSLLSCGGISLTCGKARSGERKADNGDYYMTRYTEAQAPAGLPYGSAVSGATIPVRGKVLWAGLYWSGTGPRPNEPAARLRVPGADRYVTVAASRVDSASGADFGSVYQASADVTSLVRGSRGGTWWVAVDRDAFKGGFNAYGGWALLVVVDAGGPQRTVAVFDGFTPLARGASYSSPLWGVPGPASVGLVAWEGDRTLAGERLTVGGAAVGGGNVVGGWSGGTPTGWHTLGTDARVLPARPRTATLTASSTTDAWLLGPVAVVSG